MPINTIEYASRFASELDKLMVQSAQTGFFADNAFKAKFVGAKTVFIPDMEMQGLANYVRDTGFTGGAIAVGNTAYEMTMDRARSFMLDPMDADESGVANLAGQVMGEFVRTKVVPEIDSYVISKLSGLAVNRNNTIEGDIDAPYKAFKRLVTEVREVAGYDEELVAFIDGRMMAVLESSTEFSRMITVSDFKQGEINLRVKSIDGIALIPVTSSRMKTAYNFLTSGEGGFVPFSNALSTYMLVLPKKAAHLVKKHEKIRIFTPDQNLNADSYKFDYRLYYDVFVKKSNLDTIWAWVSPAVTISAQPSDVTKTAGSISGSLNVAASAASGTLSYQWFKAKDENGNGAVKIKNARSASLTIPTNLNAGEHYFFVDVIVDGVGSTRSSVATVTVTEST